MSRFIIVGSGYLWNTKYPYFTKYHKDFFGGDKGGDKICEGKADFCSERTSFSNANRSEISKFNSGTLLLEEIIN